MAEFGGGAAVDVDAFVRGEFLAPTVDPLVFTTAHPYVAGSTEVIFRGLDREKGYDFTESGPQQITFSYAPEAGGRTPRINYIRSDL